MNKLKKITLEIAVIIITALVVMTAIWGCTSTVEPDDGLLETQHSRGVYVLSDADYRFAKLIDLQERTGEDEESYFVGVLDSDLNASLEELVDAYNADPQTKQTINVDDLRFWLTDGIVEATAKSAEGSAFYDFIAWTDELADLVDSDGNKVEVRSITNYNYVKDQNGLLSNYRYSWE